MKIRIEIELDTDADEEEAKELLEMIELFNQIQIEKSKEKK